MAKLCFLGTCGGTEPMENMHHASVVLEVNDTYYWFDAGEGCARTAHLSGMDLLKVKSIFISHPHIDHMDGLCNLGFNFYKLSALKEITPQKKKIDFFISDVKLWEYFYNIITHSNSDYDTLVDIKAFAITDGLIFQDENIRVEAIHNHHILGNERVAYLSYSFRIQIGDKTVIYSGDLKDMDDLRRIVGNGCDYLMVETGHHKVLDVCKTVDELPVGRLLFTHHGRAIINDPETAFAEMKSYGKNPVICRDGMTIEIE